MPANQVLATANPSLQAVLEPFLRYVTVTSGDVLLKSGAACEHVYFPTTALLSRTAAASEANGLEIDMLGRFETAGVVETLTGSASGENVVAQISGVTLAAPAQALRALALKSPDLLQYLLGAVTAAERNRAGKVECNTLHTTDERLACWLLRAQDRVENDHLALTQDALGKALGVRRTTLNAAALGLKRARAIRYARGGIEVLDRVALEARSCRCYAAMRALEPAVLTDGDIDDLRRHG